MYIFSWLGKLLEGDQSAAPPDARIERDAEGRIVSVSRTLKSDIPAPTGPDIYPSLVLGESIRPRLSEACDWLTSRNISLAREHGIGTETSCVFDQGEGTFEMIFSDGRKIVANAQFLGSYDPRDRTFLWSWANPSVLEPLCEDARLAQAEGRRIGEAALTTPRQTAKYNELVALLAFVAQISGADGLHLSTINGTTSSFTTFRIDAHVLPDGTRVDASAFFADRADDEMLAASAVLARSYDREMFAVDRTYHTESDESTQAMKEGLAVKREIYRRYWTRDDDYHWPISFGWPSDHDPDEFKLSFTARHPLGGALDISLKKMVGKNVYRFERVGDALRLTDLLIEWGEGFVWPVAP